MLREELKKIWRPGVLVLLILLGFIFYEVSDFHVNSATGGEFAAELIDIYGITLEPNELAELEATIPALVAEADGHVRASTWAQELGISTYNEFLTLWESVLSGAYSGELSDAQWQEYSYIELVLNYLLSDDTGNIYGRINTTQEYIRLYNLFAENGIALTADSMTEREYENAAQLFFDEENAWTNIIPEIVPSATFGFVGVLLIWSLISICILLSPIQVKDRIRKMNSLQWSSRRGKHVLNMQLFATVISAFIVATINLLIFGSMFFSKGISAFADSGLFSFLMEHCAWVGWNYATWSCVLIAMYYLFCLSIAAIVFFCSCRSSHYISMLLKVVPFAAACIFIAQQVFSATFYYNNPLYMKVGIPMIELIVTGVVIVIGIALAVMAVAKPKKRDLLNA